MSEHGNGSDLQHEGGRSVFTPSLAALDAADAGGVEVSATSGNAKRYAVVAGVLAIGIALLFFMRQAGMGPRPAEADVIVDYQFQEKRAAEAVELQQEVLEELNRAGPPVQFETEEIGRNPFRLKAPLQITDGSPETAAENAGEVRVMDALSRLRLQTVIDGRIPVARISGKTVRVGDRVGELFVAESISGRSVTLRAGDRVFTLEMNADE